MPLLRGFWERMRARVARRTIENEVGREMRLDVDLLGDEYERSGMPPGEARRAALRRFGNLRRMTEEGLDVRGGATIGVLADLRHAVRGIAGNRAFSITVALTLALAIGANAAVFSVVHSVLLRWPYPHADRLVIVATTHLERGGQNSVSIADYQDWQRHTTSFEAMAVYRAARELVDPGQNPPLNVIRATPALHQLLGMRPVLGRLLDDDDLRPGVPPVVVLSHPVWIGQFGGDDAVVGKVMRLNDRPHTIIGVAEPIPGPLLMGFTTVAFAGVIVPWIVEDEPAAAQRGLRVLAPIVARLRPGAALAQAQAELDVIGAALREQHPESNGAWTPQALSLADAMVSRARPALTALLGATLLMLIIAVSNVANLSIARGTARRAELTVRAALGAGRLRLARLLLAESLVLALVAGLGGTALAYAAIHLLLALEPVWIPRLQEISVDPTALVATLAVTMASGVLCGLAPMVVLRGGSLAGRVAAGVRTEGHGAWLRSGLLVTQVALSLILVAGSALMVRSFVALLAVPIGIDYRNIVTFSLPGTGGMRVGPALPEHTVQLQQYRDVLERVRSVPGVRGATLTSQTPLSGGYVANDITILSGVQTGEAPLVDMVAVTEDFFALFDSRAVAGRLFTPEDAARPDDAVVVDANLARMLWPDESAVGQRIRLHDVDSEVIGVSDPVRYGALTQEMRPKLYHLLGRSGGGVFGGTFLARIDGRPDAMAAAIDVRVREVDSALEVVGLRPLADIYDGYLREPRFYLLLLGALGVLALVVATIGVYGLVAYSVTRRLGEVGIRMVLGAGWLQIVALFCRRTLVLVGAGLSAGLLGAAWLTRYIENLLFGIEPTDPVALASTAALLAAAALAATLVPVRRALRVDPASTLRSE